MLLGTNSCREDIGRTVTKDMTFVDDACIDMFAFSKVTFSDVKMTLIGKMNMQCGSEARKSHISLELEGLPPE